MRRHWLVVTAIAAAIVAMVAAIVAGWPASTREPASDPTAGRVVTPTDASLIDAFSLVLTDGERTKLSDEQLQLRRTRLEEMLEDLKEDDPNEKPTPGLARTGHSMEWYEMKAGRDFDRDQIRGELEKTGRELTRRHK